MKVSNGRDVDYDVLLNNVDMMINTLEYDSQRSAGKCKVNASSLNDLYQLKDNVLKRKPKAAKKEG